MVTLDRFFKASTITDSVMAKATIATGTVTAQVLAARYCAASTATGATCEVFSSVNVLLRVLLVLMAFDLMTGIMAARAEGQRLTSFKLGLGASRKTTMLMVVAGAAMLDAVFASHGLPNAHLLYLWTTSWFIAVETLSLYENADRMGLPLPKFLRTSVEWLLERAESGGSGAIPKEKEKKTKKVPPPTS